MAINLRKRNWSDSNIWQMVWLLFMYFLDEWLSRSDWREHCMTNLSCLILIDNWKLYGLSKQQPAWVWLNQEQLMFRVVPIPVSEMRSILPKMMESYCTKLFTAQVANIHKHLATYVTSKTHKYMFFHTQVSAQCLVLADIESPGMGISVGKEKFVSVHP